MSKTLTVATDVQKAIIENVLSTELTSGFWKEARPANHADAWAGITIKTGTSYGTHGFSFLRNYNFVNPEFLKRTEEKLLAAGKTVNPDLTNKQLKKQLILLSRIVGGRISQENGTITKLARGKRAGTTVVAAKENAPSVRRVPVTPATTMATTETVVAAKKPTATTKKPAVKKAATTKPAVKKAATTKAATVKAEAVEA